MNYSGKENTNVDNTVVRPYNQDEEKTSQLSRMFNTISGQYDRFNDLMSWGMARFWRRYALKRLSQYDPRMILDIATGTADMCIKAFKHLHPEQVTGVDISDRMMAVGLDKISKAGLEGKITLEVQDCASLTFPDSSFDAATIAFGIRNFEKLNESLRQIHRVLKPGGHLLVIEMNEPQKGLLLWGYKLYVQVFVRLSALLFSSDKKAYNYLMASMHAFPNGKRLLAIMEQEGFKTQRYHLFFPGVCSMYLVEK